MRRFRGTLQAHLFRDEGLLFQSVSISAPTQLQRLVQQYSHRMSFAHVISDPDEGGLNSSCCRVRFESVLKMVLGSHLCVSYAMASIAGTVQDESPLLNQKETRFLRLL